MNVDTAYRKKVKNKWRDQWYKMKVKSLFQVSVFLICKKKLEV